MIDGEINRERIRPGNLPLKDVAYVLEQLAVAINELAADDQKSSVGKRVSVNLVGISDGSGRYVLQSDDAGHRYANKIIDALENRDGSKLSPKARNAVTRIHGRAKKSGWSEFKIESRQSGGRVHSVSVLSTQQLFRKQRLIGDTSLLATILKAGGEQGKTCAEIRLIDGQRVNAKVKTKELTESLGRLLYQTVELKGRAVYDAETMVLDQFAVFEIGEYGSLDPAVALSQISVIDADRWIGVDVTAHLNGIRSEGIGE